MAMNSKRSNKRNMIGHAAVTLVMVLSALQTAESYVSNTISTYAGVQGSPSFGGDSGPATSALFNVPNDV